MFDSSLMYFLIYILLISHSKHYFILCLQILIPGKIESLFTLNTICNHKTQQIPETIGSYTKHEQTTTFCSHSEEK